MSAFDKLMAFQRDTTALGEIAGRLHWDQETTMPRGAAAQRGAEVAAIEGILHARRTLSDDHNTMTVVQSGHTEAGPYANFSVYKRIA